MLRVLLICMAAGVACAGVMSCASDQSRELDAAVRSACKEEGSPADNPTYDEACMRNVREQILAARAYHPTTRPPKKKK